MNLERLSIALRPRTAQEAVDLGFRFAIQHWRPLYAAWFSLVLPVGVLVFLLCEFGFENYAWFYLILWWLKPLFDRVALHVISHAVFGDIPSVRETWRALPRLLWSSRLFAALTWGRFSPVRSLILPVDVLEGLKGKAARQRKALLKRKLGSTATLLGILFQSVLEPVLWLSGLSLFAWLVPTEMWPEFDDTKDFFMHSPLLITLVLYVPLVIVSFLLEPLYVAGGFMLYIKRRTDLEAWDIDLQLRQINHTHQAVHADALAHRIFSLLACTILAGGLLFQITPAKAAEDPHRDRAMTEAPAAIKQVMKDPRFGTPQTRYNLRWREQEEKARPSSWPDWLANALKGLLQLTQNIGDFLASLGRIGGWLLAFAAVCAVLYLIARFGRLPNKVGSHIPLAELAGFDIRPQSLPTDIAEAALACLQQGDARAALSLLFRGALSVLAYQHHVAFVRGDTEGDCLMRVQKNVPARFTYFARLLGCWQRLAYAHEQIAATEVKALCQDWPREFGSAARA